jgi:hypothetical protein
MTGRYFMASGYLGKHRTRDVRRRPAHYAFSSHASMILLETGGGMGRAESAGSCIGRTLSLIYAKRNFVLNSVGWTKAPRDAYSPCPAGV